MTQKQTQASLIMNPIRLRILQYLTVHKAGTAGEMLSELTDIAPASLYRHVRILHENGLLQVLEERKIRGTVERVYALSKHPVDGMSQQEIASMIQLGLMSLAGSFQQYFASGEVSPENDMLGFSTSTLMLTDEEFAEFMQKISSIIQEALQHTCREGRKPRHITLISSPSGEAAERSE